MNRSQIIARARAICHGRRDWPEDERLRGCGRACRAFTALDRTAPGSERTEAAALTVILWAAEELRWREKRQHDQARAAVRAARTKAARARLALTAGVDLAAVRAWAKAHGHTVADRGAIAQSVILAYQAAAS